MAQERQKYVELYAPGGTQVEVPEKRAEVLKDRGYTTSKPRNPRTNSSRRQADNSAELEAMRQENERLKAELDAAKAGGEGFPPPQQ